MIEDILLEHVVVANRSLNNLISTLPAIVEKIVDAFNSEKKLMICGNGGSAADAQHLAAEFVSAYSRNLDRRGLPAIALTVDTSILTAYSNDFNFDGVFARQVEAIGNKGDILLVFSTSGDSINCIKAVLKAKEIGITTLAFTGRSGKLVDLVDHCLIVESTNTQHIQEIHQVAYHALVGLIEARMF
jgi:D-sedoheptulose 7-phosphate isomerase